MIDMYPDLNPYAPGSGLRPPELAGRDAELDLFELLLARTRQRNHSRGIILHGLRGVGKTVLLKRFAHQAERAEWLTIEIEGSQLEGGGVSARSRLARGLATALRKLDRTATVRGRIADALGSVASFSLSLGITGVSVGVQAAAGRASTGQVDIDLEDVIEDLAPVLLDNSTALGVFIDEMQDLDPELLGALLAVQHRAGQNGWPFFVLGAGLPSLPAVLAASRSYSERQFDYRMLGPIPDEQAAGAVRLPAERLGIGFQPEAIAAIVSAAEGYPYFLQVFAMKAWDAAVGTEITADDAALGIADGRLDLDMGFYPARWDRASPAERRYMEVMSRYDGGECGTAEIAEALGSTQRGLSTVRHSLISKGLIHSTERGLVAFTVPGMSAFVQRQVGD
jgi:hypothetical protein